MNTIKAKDYAKNAGDKKTNKLIKNDNQRIHTKIWRIQNPNQRDNNILKRKEQHMGIHRQRNNKMEAKTIEAFKDKAKENLIKDGWLLPIAALEDRQNKITIIGFTQENKQQENQMEETIRKQLLTGQYKSYLLIQDIWYVITKKPTGIKPSQNKDRKEAIIIIYQTEEGDKQSIMIPYIKENNEYKFEKEMISNQLGKYENIWR